MNYAGGLPPHAEHLHITPLGPQYSAQLIGNIILISLLSSLEPVSSQAHSEVDDDLSI